MRRRAIIGADGRHLKEGCLSFACASNSATITLSNVEYNNVDIWYEKNNGGAILWDGIEPINIVSGDVVKMAGENPNGFSKQQSNSCIFKISGYMYAGGNLNSLISEDYESITKLPDYCFYALFYFSNNLKSSPELPATTIGYMCYLGMFVGCKNLVTAPALPATKLANYCYDMMFYGCTSLVNAPALPATKLANYCYYQMFYGCTSLVNAPTLPATALVNGCYNRMFQGCTKLTYIKAMFTTTPSSGYNSNWVSGVAENGTFVKNAAATWNVVGENGVPEGWTIETATE